MPNGDRGLSEMPLARSPSKNLNIASLNTLTAFESQSWIFPSTLARSPCESLIFKFADIFTTFENQSCDRSPTLAHDCLHSSTVINMASIGADSDKIRKNVHNLVGQFCAGDEEAFSNLTAGEFSHLLDFFKAEFAFHSAWRGEIFTLLGGDTSRDESNDENIVKAITGLKDRCETMSGRCETMSGKCETLLIGRKALEQNVASLKGKINVLEGSTLR